MSTSGAMVCGRGARGRAAVVKLAMVADQLRKRFDDRPVAYGYLQVASPAPRVGSDALRGEDRPDSLAVHATRRLGRRHGRAPDHRRTDPRADPPPRPESARKRLKSIL